MITKAKQISKKLILPVIVAGLALITGCENDLKDLQKISASEVNKPIERYTDVDVIYSDSARVKAHMTAPLMINYKVKKPYTEMPKGVKVIFYDNNLKESCDIVADYGVYYEADKTIILRKNVIGTNANGDTFTSDELVWDEQSKQIHSSKLVHIRMADGSVTDGTSFVSDESLNHWTLTQGTGNFNIKSEDISH